MTRACHHIPKRREHVTLDGVGYHGFECALCGQRNVYTEGEESQVNRFLFDLFVG